MTDKIAETTMVTLTGGVVIGWLPLVLGIPAAAYYSLRFYRLWKEKRSS